MASKTQIALLDRQVYTLTTPANTIPERFTVPFSRGLLMGVYSSLTTSATVGNRQVVLNILERGQNFMYQIPSPSSQAASLAYTYVWVPGIGAYASGVSTLLLQPLPSVGLPVERFDTLQVREQAGHTTDDAFGPIRFVFTVEKEETRG